MIDNPGRQRGATLIISLIMLVMITLLVVSAMTMGFTNLKVVGNQQYRNEAVAAANSAIEQLLSADFSLSPTAKTIYVDIDRNGTNDYTVAIDAPVCLSSRPEADVTKCTPTESYLTGVSFGTGGGTALCRENKWDIRATVTGSGGSGLVIHQGVVLYASKTC